MAEPITMTIGALIWEYALKPIADSIKKEYGDETKKLLKKSLNSAFHKLPFVKKEQEVIEAEIIEADIDILRNQDSFLEYLQKNSKIEELLKSIEKREPNINTIIKNSYNEIKIDGSHNSISF